MAKAEMIRARVEPDLKREAEELFSELGLSATEVITLFYRTGDPASRLAVRRKGAHCRNRRGAATKLATEWASLDTPVWRISNPRATDLCACSPPYSTEYPLPMNKQERLNINRAAWDAYQADYMQFNLKECPDFFKLLGSGDVMLDDEVVELAGDVAGLRIDRVVERPFGGIFPGEPPSELPGAISILARKPASTSSKI